MSTGIAWFRCGSTKFIDVCTSVTDAIIEDWGVDARGAKAERGSSEGGIFLMRNFLTRSVSYVQIHYHSTDKEYC